MFYNKPNFIPRGPRAPTLSFLFFHIYIITTKKDTIIYILGYSQAERHRTLTPAFVGSNPATLTMVICVTASFIISMR